ncbi:hypothetical protein [Hyalangium versicolor]|uniref:hypothetical protein n=1 Tax=Hyalangium versicolor TaxID=2861190 RepID=UPI001CCBE32C|nr:hypothetical protein [Hyalangium versicolor]
MKFLPAFSALVLVHSLACADPVEPLSSGAAPGSSTLRASLGASCVTQQVTAVSAGTGTGYPAPTSFAAIAGRQYQVTVSGTYFANDGLYADARYSSRLNGPWQDAPSHYESYGPTLLDLQIWDPSTSAYVSPDWGPYSADHSYSTSWVAAANQLNFRIADFSAGNNTGSLTVTVCEVPPTCIEQTVTAVAPGGGAGYPAPTAFPVTAGHEYDVTVSGTYFANDGLYADARYSSRFNGPWQETPNNYESHGPTLLDLQFWDPSTSAYVSPDWGPYASSHVYSTRWTATSNQLNVRINDYFAGNDSGFLSVVVCEVPPPCVTQEVSAVGPGGGEAYPPPTSFPAITGTEYEITVSGTYFANDGLYADARYSSRFNGPWQDIPNNYESHGPTLLDMQIWDPFAAEYSSPDWGPYSSSHTYSTRWMASADELIFRINDYFAGNDSGSLTVKICPLEPR